MVGIRALVIEDNEALVANIFEYFEPLGFAMDTALDGIAGLHLAQTNNYDLIVLDIMLPGINGFELCKRLRQGAGVTTPVIMLTAKDELFAKLEGFRSGADDYLVKPFSLLELEARIRALVRRTSSNTMISSQLSVGDLHYEQGTLVVSRQGRICDLNPTCRRILEILMLESPRVVMKSRIEAELWGDNPPANDVLRSHIYTLRQAIDGPFEVKLLKTVPRVGYRLVADDVAT